MTELTGTGESIKSPNFWYLVHHLGNGFIASYKEEKNTFIEEAASQTLFPTDPDRRLSPI